MSKKILILEDDQATAELMKFYLEEEGYKVNFFLKGNNFVEKVIEYQPDLISINIILPDTNGLKIYKDLKKDEHTKNIPVIFVTGVYFTEKNISEIGVAGYLSKPFKKSELKKIVKSVLNVSNNK